MQSIKNLKKKINFSIEKEYNNKKINFDFNKNEIFLLKLQRLYNVMKVKKIYRKKLKIKKTKKSKQNESSFSFKDRKIELYFFLLSVGILFIIGFASYKG